jgi:DNA-binding MarR family transcriptional regulator
MQLEHEIKQSKPIPSEYLRLTINLLFSGSWCNDFCHQHFKTFGLTHPQYNVLRILRGSNPTPMNVMDVQSRMIERSSNITRLVVKLLDKNYVTRTINPNNKRAVFLAITPVGLDLMTKIDGSMPKIEAKMKNLTLDEALRLNELLDKLRD